MRATVQGTVSPGARRRDWVPVLAQVPLFEGVSKRHLGRIARVATTRRFSQMSRIVQADDTGNTFYVILDGQVSVLRNGRRIARLGTGEAFGELALLSDAPRAATVVADTDVTTMCLSRTAFNKVLKSEPAVSVALLRTLAERLRASERSHAH
jgi:CRP-like cAMP-binding protein